jgi:hypothetical protein
LELNRSIQFSEGYVDGMGASKEDVGQSREDVRRSVDLDMLGESREDLKDADVKSVDIDDQLEKLELK